MIDIADVEQTILKLEKSGTTYSNCSTLADLYTVRNEYYSKKGEANTKMELYSYANRSEFLEALQNADKEKAYAVLDEHFSVIKTLYPKEYTKILRLLKNQ